MKLNKIIREKLEEVDDIVFYGMAGNIREDVLWNYTLFFRERRRISENKNGKNYVFHVVIVRENEIPEGLDDIVIAKVLEIPGVRQSGDAEYAYTIKQNTGAAVEALDITFVKPMKVV